jgi:hypothetical protein
MNPPSTVSAIIATPRLQRHKQTRHGAATMFTKECPQFLPRLLCAAAEPQKGKAAMESFKQAVKE